jgi:hypothetical protein
MAIELGGVTARFFSFHRIADHLISDFHPQRETGEAFIIFSPARAPRRSFYCVRTGGEHTIYAL